MQKVIEASRLYVIKPSRISEVNGRFMTIKTEDGPNQKVIQRVKFESIPSQIIIAEKQNDYIFTAFNNNQSKYYRETSIAERGLFSRQKSQHFIGIFPGDITDLATFLFIQNNPKLSKKERIKYFIDPSKKGHKKLKPAYATRENLNKKEYTIDELIELRQKILELNDNNFSKAKTKKYTVPLMPRGKYFLRGKFYPSRDTYAGTSEENAC